MVERKGQRLRDTYKKSRGFGTVGGSYDPPLPKETLSQKGNTWICLMKRLLIEKKR